MPLYLYINLDFFGIFGIRIQAILLQTKDVNSAMEAAKKSQDAFAAAHVELKKSQKKEAIVSIKRVVDFSFEGVEELVRLVMLAFNSINHQGLRGDRE